jgi:hypothetical protein
VIHRERERERERVFIPFRESGKLEAMRPRNRNCEIHLFFWFLLYLEQSERKQQKATAEGEENDEVSSLKRNPRNMRQRDKNQL